MDASWVGVRRKKREGSKGKRTRCLNLEKPLKWTRKQSIKSADGSSLTGVIQCHIKLWFQAWLQNECNWASSNLRPERRTISGSGINSYFVARSPQTTKVCQCVNQNPYFTFFPFQQFGLSTYVLPNCLPSRGSSNEFGYNGYWAAQAKLEALDLYQFYMGVLAAQTSLANFKIPHHILSRQFSSKSDYYVGSPQWSPEKRIFHEKFANIEFLGLSIILLHYKDQDTIDAWSIHMLKYYWALGRPTKDTKPEKERLHLIVPSGPSKANAWQ